jgi:nitronate monooxygenase
MPKNISIKIGKHKFKYPIFQGGMGIRISLTRLAIASSKAGVVPVVALVGTGPYLDNYIPSPENLTSRESIIQILKDIRKEIGKFPIFCNIMVALSDYENVVRYAIEAGFDGIISGAGLPISLPGHLEAHPNIAMIPIVADVRTFKILMHQWKKRYKKEIIPDAIVIEGPLAGGHLGFKEEEIFFPEKQLEVTLPILLDFIHENGWNIPVIAAGGLHYSSDIKKVMQLGAYGVQIGTRFLGTLECDASDTHKKLLIECTKEDIVIDKSPAGYPCRKIKTSYNLPKKPIICKVNCLTNCKRGKSAREINKCIAYELMQGVLGEADGLYMVGARGYEITEIITVEELVQELIQDL